ncbi:MAG: alpha/beta fold hydrolase [Acidobacteriota bacterium]|nr:alpha/beta fold hydrolase [Acidobacteriota bacterium]
MTAAVLIHGFSGSPASWRRVKALLDVPSRAPAVCGHGGESAPAISKGPAAFEAEVDRLAAVVRAEVPAARLLVGYSLGGRLALGLLVRHPDLFLGAVLIGANPGIGGEDARVARRHEDERWARLIEEEGLAVFDNEWSALPLFASQHDVDAGRLAEQQRTRLGHDPAALAAAMRTLSLGAMPDYRPALPGVACPVDLIAGSLDTTFVALARKMAEKLPQASVRIVDGVGHNVPLEAPSRLARLLNDSAMRTAVATRGPASGRRPERGRD